MNRVAHEFQRPSIGTRRQLAGESSAKRLREVLIRNIASPYGLAAISFCLFLAAYFFPPGAYSNYLQERDYLFLDPATLLFYVLCTMGFVIGLIVVDVLYRAPGFVTIRRTSRISPMWFILLPVIVCTAFTALFCFVLLRDNARLIELLLAAQASDLKTEGGMEVNGPAGQAIPMLMGVVWWALWRKREFNLRGRQRMVVNACIVLATVALFVSSTLLVSRGELMPIVAGIATVILLLRLKEHKLTLASMSRFALIASFSVLALFTVFTVLRGQSSPDVLIGDILGYTIAGYNRLAALLSGRLRYPFSGRGIYVSAYLAFSRSFNSIFHVNRIFEWPDFNTVWRGEFDAVSAAGLNGRLIWSGTFGYVFTDFGWFSPLVLFVYGVITGWTWRLLRLGKTAGIVLYPWCAFCILFWFGTNYLFDAKLMDLLFVVSALSIYEALFSRTRTEMVPG
jgi:hypothetical protein